MVLALPRGGVPVAYEVAKALGAPLHVFVVRKLGVPGYEELAMGAIASGDLVLDEALVEGWASEENSSRGRSRPSPASWSVERPRTATAAARRTWRARP